MKKCKLVQNIRNFKSCYFIFCTMICLVFSCLSAQERSRADLYHRNTGIDALHYTVRSDFIIRNRMGKKSSRLIAVMPIHRRENLGETHADMFGLYAGSWKNLQM